MARGRNLDIAGRAVGGIRWNPCLIFDPVFGNVFGPTANPTGPYANGVFGPDGFFLPAPLQLFEPWTEYAGGALGAVLSNPPWQFSAGVTASQPTHLVGAGDIHSQDSASQVDQFVGSIVYTQDSLNHVDVTRPIRVKWSTQFALDGTGFNAGAQFLLALGPFVSVTNAVNCSTGAASISSAATGFVTFNYTDDFSVRSFQFDLGGNDSGGAGKNKLTFRMNGSVVASGTINNQANGQGGTSFSVQPAFTCRLNNRVFKLFAMKFYYYKI